MLDQTGHYLNTVEALIGKSGRNWSWSLSRMKSCKRPVAETIEADLLPELIRPSSLGNTLDAAVNHLEF